MGKTRSAAEAIDAPPPDESTLWDARCPFTAEQRAAIEWADGPLAVLAGPGAGKTRVLVGRVAHCVAPRDRGGRGADPRSVLAVTFTVKAAEELRARLRELLGFEAAESVQAATFHSFGRRIVQRFGDALDLPPDLLVMDSAQQRRLLRKLMLDSDAYRRRASLGLDRLADEAIAFIGACKQCALDAAACMDLTRAWRERFDAGVASLGADKLDAERARLERCERLADLYGAFERAALAQGMISLDDYMILPLRILKGSPAICAILRDETRHIVVDEFQDVNAAQIELLRLLAPAPDADICVVGDDDQAIYGFRGADTRAFQRFAAIWPAFTERRLTHNFRSAPRIVSASNAIIEKAATRFASDKAIVAAPDDERALVGLGPLDDEGKVEGVLIDAASHDGDAVAAVILAEQAANPDKPWRDFGVIVRGGVVFDRVRAALEFHGVPVSTRRALCAADDPQVQTLMAWLRLVADPEDESSARRALHEPPISADGEAIIAWHQQWRAERAAGASDPASASFARWLVRQCGGDVHVARFADVFSHLRDQAAIQSAHGLALEIVRALGLGATASGDPRDSARAVSCLAAALRFIAQIATRLDPPADVETFLAHYNDLDADEQAMRLRGDDRVDAPPDESPDDEDAVSLLTAHSAKGLEFDTVIIVGVRPVRGTGFPSSGRSDDSSPFHALPPGARDVGDDPDEERRLFYVACTRARHSLRLIAKRKKTRTAGDFFNELEAADPPLVACHVDAWRERGRAAMPDEMQAYVREQTAGGNPARARLEAELHRARAAIVAALHGFERSDLVGSERAAEQRRLLAAVDRLSTLGALARGNEPPAFLRSADHVDAPLRDELLALVERFKSTSACGDIAQPLEAPISLSYSALNLFRQCPRCFYAQHALRMEEPPTRRMLLGSAVHDALQRCFAALRSAEAEGRQPPDDARLLELAARLLDQLPPRRRLSDASRAEALAMVRNALDLHDRRTEILELERSVSFQYDAGALGAHRLSARLDRVDRAPSGALRIIDYKTGNASKGLLDPDAADLQLSVYAMALPELFGGQTPIEGEAEYWLLSTGERGVIDLADLDLDTVRASINDDIAKMLAGEFPRKPPSDYGGCQGLCLILGPG